MDIQDKVIIPIGCQPFQKRRLVISVKSVKLAPNLELICSTSRIAVKIVFSEPMKILTRSPKAETNGIHNRGFASVVFSNKRVKPRF